MNKIIFTMSKRAVYSIVLVGSVVVAYRLGKISGYIHLGMDILDRLSKEED